MPVKKIVVIGPESTGKSTLCQKLADHYKTLWVPEYAREYLEKNGAEYHYDDLLTIAKGQLESENNITGDILFQPGSGNQHNLLLIDTDMYVMKVWAEFVFNQCHNWILDRIAERKYDLYLLCDIDLPWVEDPLREYPDQKIRARLFHFYKDVLVNQTTPWCHIYGNYEDRFLKAISFIEQSFT